VKIQFRGRRVAFGLLTGNRDAASRRAVSLYAEIVNRGIDAVLAERSLKKIDDETTPPTTIGAWIDAASKVFAGKAVTFGSYARALRFVGSEILSVAKDKKRSGRTQAKAYRQKVDDAPLSILTAGAIQAWRIRYVEKVGESPAKQRAARTTCNSYLRAAKSLFSRKIAKFAGDGMALPSPLPFAEVEFFPRESMRYLSKIDHSALLREASQELAKSDRDAFVALILALGAGLRRAEIDRLLWRQIDCQRGMIHVEITEAAGLKSSDSTGSVALDETLSSILQGFKAKATSEYVLEEGSSFAGSKTWGRHYRCQEVFDRLTLWLRKHGVESRAPIHTLRKEAGSIVATESGIFAASRFLRHADIQMTAQVYADHKERSVVNMTALLPPSNVIALEKDVD
jgi:integrase